MTATHDDPIMTVAETAAYLAVAESWIYDNWRSAGMPAVKLGRQLRFRRSALDAWLDSQQAA
jgi:excisionase family DNA binding protein